MQRDSKYPASMMHGQAASQKTLVQSFQCSHCVLIFKTKLFLLEHLNKVHGFNVDSALRDAGLSPSGPNTPFSINTDNHSSGSGDIFACRHCVFKASSWDIVSEHEKKCHVKIPEQNPKGHLISSRSPETKIVVMSKEVMKNVKEVSPLQHKQASGGEVNSSSVKSTSKTKYKTTNSLKDLKTYKKPSQPITNFFTAASGSKVKPDLGLKSPDHSGTLILHDSHSSSRPNNDGVFKVAATSKHDLSRTTGDRFLLYDHVLINGPSSHKVDQSDDQLKRPSLNTTDKRTIVDPASSPSPPKKTKTEPSGSAADKTQSSSSNMISFEVSEDEEERKGNLVNGDMDKSQVYCCKHCDYTNEGIHSMCTHYQKSHPYVRYKFEYIRDPDDWSATFRCLECPVEFSTVVELKRHYRKNHPEASDVLSAQSRELDLVFKCFVCAFTTDASRILKEHYQDKHPMYKVNSSLMYCKYSVNRCQEESPQLNTSEKTSVPKPSDSSAQIPSKDVDASPQQSPASKTADGTLYVCKICKFSHKSVIVMHVHYQKSHPAAGMTIDKIKKSVLPRPHIKSQVTPVEISESPNSETARDKLVVSPWKRMSDSKKTKDRPESSEEKKIASALINKDKPEAESSKENMDSAEVKSKGKRVPIESSRKLSTEVNSSSSSSPQVDLFYCYFCNYSNSTVKSVIGHLNAKHTGHIFTAEDVLLHSTEMQNLKHQSTVGASASAQSSNSKIQRGGKGFYLNKGKRQHEDGVIADTLAHGSDPYERPEDLFFCPKCNFAHPATKGVLNHQAKRHNFKSTTLQILKYTAGIREEIKKSKSQPVKSLFSSALPLPLLDESDEGKVFCYLCNSRQTTLGKIADHCRKRHPGLEYKAKKVLAYSSMVHEQTWKSHQKTAAEQAVMSPGQNENEKTHTKKHANSISVSPSLSKTAAQTRSLQCHECAYNTQHVYLLKRHLRNIHKTSHTVTDVLQMAYNDGILEAGYHCEWCVFSHKEAAGVHHHCQQQHSARGVSLGHISARLYVGPNESTPKKRTSHLEDTHHSDEYDEMSPAQPSGKNEIKAYPCRACSFKGSSMHSLAGHYRAVHPWSVKEDGSVLDVIASKPGVNKQAQDTEDHNQVPEPFDSYQVPLEFDTLTNVSPQRAAAASSKMIACRLCDASFYNRHGLHTHYGKKHPDSEFPSLDDEHEVSVDTSENITGLPVFKCPRCTYVNTRKHGILAHCQMRHPAFTVRAKKLETDEVQLHDMDKPILTNGFEDKLKFAGFMCKICPVACISVKKLKTHYEQDHNQTAANILKPAPKQSAIIKNQLLSKYHSTQGSVLQGPFFKNRKYSKIQCHFCKYVCSTKIALSRHVCIHQRNAKIQKNAGDHNALYKCSLCSYASSIKKYLAKHYTRTHGKAAFLKYYAPVHQITFRKAQPASEDAPNTQQAEDTPEACPSSNLTTGNKTLIYSCPRCTYVNTSYHGTLTHCQMMHPNLTARADNLATVEIQVSNMDICVKRKGAGDKSRLSGYLCKICQVVRASMAKLKIHYEKDHNQTVPNNLKAASKHPAVIKKQLLSKYHGAQGPVSQSAFFKNKKYAVVKCSFCKYVTTTEIALSRHVQIHHKKAPETGHQDTLYKCCLCPYSSPIRYYLSKHYSRTHGKSAFLKYYAPVYQKVFRKSKFLPEGGPIIQHAEDSPENSQSVTQSEAPLYKCHLCIYSSPYQRYLSSHYKKSHGYAAYKPELSTKCGDKTFSHVESEESASLKCKKCPKLFFNTSQTLSLHYMRFHSRDLKVDFTVLPNTLMKGSKVYKCGHCNVKISSTGELCCHLDHHRELYKKKASALKTKTPPYIKESPEAQCIRPKTPDELPEFQTAPELPQWNVRKEKTFTLATGLQPSPSQPPEMEEPQSKSGEEDCTCKQCGRTFMSFTGLRVHERSHAAMASLKRLDTLSTSLSRQIFNKYTRFQSGTVKPFRCRICTYRTNIMSLLKSHLLKKHAARCSDMSESSADNDSRDGASTLRTDEEAPTSSYTQEFKLKGFTESQDESELTEKSVYSEPPDVQRQLNHYSFVAQASASATTALQHTRLPEDSLFQCEFCNFTTGHLSSVRRHYLNRHGRKVMKCRDCCFFTGLRKNLEMHIETGHSNCQSQPTHQKDLRCPLCLYQTKNKNNMIDHIVLHREERVIPIEVRRPKLSRYLQGIVFRCHKCTFTSASADNLRLHILKHDNIKPYKCRLCYFDCSQLSDLEAHLCDKHQVVRNHELVGQINLDQLEARVDKMSEEEEGFSNLAQQDNEAEDIETNIKMEEEEREVAIMMEPPSVSHENQEENISDNCSKEYAVKPGEYSHQKQAANQAESDIRESIKPQCEDPHQKQGQEAQKDDTPSLVTTAALGLQDEKFEKQSRQEQDTLELQAGGEMMDGQEMKNILKQKVRDGSTFEDDEATQKGELDSNKEWETDETPAQHDPIDRKDSKIKQNDVALQGQETAESNSMRNGNTAEAAQTGKLHKISVQDAKARLEQSIETELEDDILCRILELDEEASMTSSHSLQKGFEIRTKVMPTIMKQNHMLVKDTGALESPTAERLWFAATTHNYEEAKINHRKQDDQESSGVSLGSCVEQAHIQKDKEPVDPYGEMPVLENEYLKQEVDTHSCQTSTDTEEEWSDDEQEQRRRDEIHEDDVNQHKKEEREKEQSTMEADNSFAPNGAFADLAGTTDSVPHPSSKAENPFSCEYCGRNLISSTELERHIMRHGM